MQINQFPEVMSSCRFCFMCRHLSAVGQVSGRESDTPRGRALIADRVRMHPEEIGNADFIEAIYRSDLSGANRFHCDGYHDGKGYDEVGLQLALRRDIVDAGYALVTACYNDFYGDTYPDQFLGYKGSVAEMMFAGEKVNVPDSSRAQAVATWAWGLGRMLDYVYSDADFTTKNAAGTSCALSTSRICAVQPS